MRLPKCTSLLFIFASILVSFSAFAKIPTISCEMMVDQFDPSGRSVTLPGGPVGTVKVFEKEQSLILGGFVLVVKCTPSRPIYEGGEEAMHGPASAVAHAKKGKTASCHLIARIQHSSSNSESTIMATAKPRSDDRYSGSLIVNGLRAFVNCDVDAQQ